MEILRIILVFILTGYVHDLTAQQINYQFDRITTEQGLTSNRINDIEQDKTGYIWIATNNGLNRFDGVEVKTYTNVPGDSSSLAGNAILSLFCDKQNQLWVLTLNTLHKYIPHLDKFEKFTFSNQNISYRYENNGIITADPAGNLWISSPLSGIFRLSKVSGKIERILPHLGEVSTIFAPLPNQIWLGKRDGEVLLYNPQTNQITEFRHPQKGVKHNNDDYVWHIWQEGPDKFNLLLSSGFYQINLNNHIISANRIWNQIIKNEDKELRSIYPDKNKLWVGTQAKGLYIIDLGKMSVGASQNYFNNKNTLSNNSVTAILKDLSGVYWIATKDGLNKFDPASELFEHYQNEPGNPNSLHYNFVSSFCEATNGNIWIGTFGQGISLFNKEKNHFTTLNNAPGKGNILSSNFVRTINADGEGNIWIGTTNGLTCYRSQNKQYIQYRSDGSDRGLASNDILSVLIKKDGEMWIGTNGHGVSRANGKSLLEGGFKNYGTKNGFLSSDKIRKIIELKNGTICLGTLGGGADFIINEKVRNVSLSTYSKKIDSDYINALCEDLQGQIWIGTWDGLFMLDSSLTIKNHFGTFNGLASSEISGIVLDNKGDLWISSMNGLSHLTKKRNSEFIITNYTTRNGLQGTYFTTYATLKSNDGDIYFGGFNGFNRFTPEKIILNRETPKVIFTDLQVFNQSVPIDREVNGKVILKKSISHTKSITLNNKHKVIGFRFSAIVTSQSDKIKYACLLRGVDPDWVYLAPNQRSVIYNNLKPGKYELEVKACNADGIWSEKGTTLEIIVLPPFWKTWWAYLIYAIAIAVIILLVRKNIQAHSRLENKALVEKIHREKDAEINQQKITFFTNISHEIRTPLSLILAPLEKLLRSPEVSQDQKATLGVIKTNTYRLLTLVNQLLDFRKIESGNIQLTVGAYELISYLNEIIEAFEPTAAQKQIDVSLKTNSESVTLWFDPDSFDKIMYNLLSNAFKFTPQGGKVQITVNHLPHEGICEILVRDTGIGVSPDQLNKLFDPFYQVKKDPFHENESEGSGIGLSIVKNLVAQLKGEIRVESIMGSYTLFRMIFKTGKSHFENDQSIRLNDQPQEYAHKRPLFDETTPVKKISNKISTEHNVHIQGNPSILLVEDNSDIRNYLTDSLRQDFNILEAANGKVGCEVAIRQIPDLIISDIMMPETDGIELCNILKNNSLTNHIPIILLTAKSTLDDTLEGLETGADDYISKPFSTEILKAKIGTLLFNRRLLQEKFTALNQENQRSKNEPDPLKFDDPFANHVVSFIYNQLSNESLSSEIIEQHFRISKIQLYRKLKAVTGWSVINLIREIRIREAKVLLSQPDLNISEIAYKLGFTDPLYFSKYFKKATGVPPIQFRKDETTN